jgi:hypothetical protein
VSALDRIVAGPLRATSRGRAASRPAAPASAAAAVATDASQEERATAPSPSDLFPSDGVPAPTEPVGSAPPTARGEDPGTSGMPRPAGARAEIEPAAAARPGDASDRGAATAPRPQAPVSIAARPLGPAGEPAEARDERGRAPPLALPAASAPRPPALDAEAPPPAARPSADATVPPAQPGPAPGSGAPRPPVAVRERIVERTLTERVLRTAVVTEAPLARGGPRSTPRGDGADASALRPARREPPPATPRRAQASPPAFPAPLAPPASRAETAPPALPVPPEAAQSHPAGVAAPERRPEAVRAAPLGGAGLAERPGAPVGPQPSPGPRDPADGSASSPPRASPRLQLLRAPPPRAMGAGSGAPTRAPAPSPAAPAIRITVGRVEVLPRPPPPAPASLPLAPRAHQIDPGLPFAPLSPGRW